MSATIENTLTEYDFIAVVDASGSMATEDMSGGRSREVWHHCWFDRSSHQRLTMVDLILIGVIVGAAYGGFRLGSKYGTIKAAWADLKKQAQWIGRGIPAGAVESTDNFPGEMPGPSQKVNAQADAPQEPPTVVRGGSELHAGDQHRPPSVMVNITACVAQMVEQSPL